MAPAISFRIFPEPKVSRLYCKVNVWRTKKEMYAYIEDGESFDGVCTGLLIRDYRKKSMHTKPIFAEMQLTLEKLNDRIITHEVVHAMFKWAIRRKVTMQQIDDKMEVEEHMCWAVTRMKDTLLLRLSQHGVEVKHTHEW
jgi:hypothetical protein